MTRLKSILAATLLHIVSLSQTHATHATPAKRSITIVNSDKAKTIYLYYDNILNERVEQWLQPQHALTIETDAHLPEPLIIHLPASIARIALCMPVMTGDTLHIGSDKENDMYTFFGQHPAEYRYFSMLESVGFSPSPMLYWTRTLQKNISYKKYLNLCQTIFQ